MDIFGLWQTCPFSHWTVVVDLRYFLTLTLFTSLTGSIPKITSVSYAILLYLAWGSYVSRTLTYVRQIASACKNCLLRVKSNGLFGCWPRLRTGTRQPVLTLLPSFDFDLQENFQRQDKRRLSADWKTWEEVVFVVDIAQSLSLSSKFAPTIL